MPRVGSHLGKLPLCSWAQGLWWSASDICITDSDRERLKMSVKTLASWSAHACSTRPGNLSDTVALGMLTYLKVLLTSAAESVITQSSGTAGALMHVSVLLASKLA